MKNVIEKLIQHLNKMLKQTINNQKGIVLPIILMAIGGLSLIGAAAVSVSSGEMNIAHNDRNYKVAFNLAEAGINDATDGISGNRDILPAPLGAINSASYSFNVGGTAFKDTGRYNVTVSLPVITSVQNTALVGASSVDVLNPATVGLKAGDSIIIGNTTIHVMTKIGSINGNTLNLVDGKNQPYILSQQIDQGMLVSKNFLRITSTGQSGVGLGSTYNAVAIWRASSSINANPNIALPAAGLGAVRSTVTLQGEYSIQEFGLFDTFSAATTSSGNNFNGPMLVTTSLDVNPYAKGDYSGPIFAPVNIITGGNIKFNNNSYDPITNGTNPTYPKVIGISTAAAAKANVTTLLANAQSNAKCFQVQCGQPTANQQIYYVNGYQLDVKAYNPGVDGNGLPLHVLEDVTVTQTRLTFAFELTSTFPMSSSDNVTVNLDATLNPTNLNSSNNVSIASMTVVYNYAPISAASHAGTITQSGNTNIVFSNGTGGQPDWFGQGTMVYVDILVSNIPATGTYLRLYDNSNNSPGFNNAKIWSNGIWVTPMGNIQSQEYEGDLNYYADAAQGSHANHSVVKTSTAGIQARGYYTANGSTVINPPNYIGGTGRAVLFGGKIISNGKMPDGTTSAWVVGDKAEFFTTYYIHTNAVNSCNDHDIKIVAQTIVTYLGTSQKCNSTDIKKLFLVETIWNHLKTNDFNLGVEADDNDPNIAGIPHKGYYKWVQSKDTTENEPLLPYQMMGDKEFNSVFNHSASTVYKSAVVNTNISNIRMIGAANPPLKWDSASSSMYVRPDILSVKGVISGVITIVSNFTMPTNSQNWDWPDMVGNKSAFVMPYMLSGTTYNATRDFDFADMNVASGSVVPYTINNSPTLPDMTMSMPTAAKQPTATTIPLYKATTNPYKVWSTDISMNPPLGLPDAGTNWVGNGTTNTPNNALFTVAGKPIMDPSQMPTTRITATISGPYFTTFEVKRGSANLFFDPANGVAFNVLNLNIETKGAGANITIGSAANPATVYANSFKLESEDCGGQINFNFTGKMVAKNVEMENNVKYAIDTVMTSGGTCLNPNNTYIYLKKSSWREIR